MDYLISVCASTPKSKQPYSHHIFSSTSSSEVSTPKSKSYYQIAFISDSLETIPTSIESVEFRSSLSPMQRAKRRLLETHARAYEYPQSKPIPRNELIGCSDIKRRIELWEKYLHSQQENGEAINEKSSTRNEKFNFVRNLYEPNIETVTCYVPVTRSKLEPLKPVLATIYDSSGESSTNTNSDSSSESTDTNSLSDITSTDSALCLSTDTSFISSSTEDLGN